MRVDPQEPLSGGPYRRDGAGRPACRTYTNGAGGWTTIYQLGQRELLTASATLRPLNARHVRHVNRGELRISLIRLAWRWSTSRAVSFIDLECSASESFLLCKVYLSLGTAA